MLLHSTFVTQYLFYILHQDQIPNIYIVGTSITLPKKRFATTFEKNSSKKAKKRSRSCFTTGVFSALFVRILKKEGTGLNKEQVLDKIIKRMNDCNMETDDNNKLAINRRITNIKSVVVGIGMVW
uniref:Uncharacterized protein n=1 Tax=Proboscia inermis TaxID=420281 RepID=A0A7S0CLU9_9STRA|mmetsp:Transcript_53159/g.53576  ORF Transcript_53159/g.53576 Transcript_53159/m.53576 type:complete len:125 (+) Transcript_53159:310-684(+)